MIEWAMDELPWWKKERKSKHYVTNKETTVYTSGGVYKTLDKNSFISPVRKMFLPYGHWALDQYDETRMIYADTPVGFCFVDIKDVDF